MYRDKGVLRNIKDIAEEYDVESFTLYNMSFTHKWKERVKAYDEKMEEIANKRKIVAIDKMNEEYIDNARALRTVGSAKVQAILDDLRKYKDNPEEFEKILSKIPLYMAPNFLTTAFEMERKARGIDDKNNNITINNNIEKKDEFDVSKMSAEDRQAFTEILNKYSGEN